MMEKEGLNMNNKSNKSMTHFILLPSNKQMDGRSQVSDDDVDLQSHQLAGFINMNLIGLFVFKH